MRAIVMRVKEASVQIDGKCHSAIKSGLLIYLGIHCNDTLAEAELITDKICKMRIFEDENGKMNLAPDPTSMQLMIVSQFTLYGDCRQRRPGFSQAARPETATALYEHCIALCKLQGFSVQTGVFGADMQVSSINDGPTTLILDTDMLSKS